MKQFLLLAFLFLSLFSLAGKPYKLDVIVLEGTTKAPISGARVQFKTEKNLLLFTTYTDQEGKAQYKDCEEKALRIHVSNGETDYSSNEYFYNQKYDIQLPIEINLVSFVIYRNKIKELSVATPIDSTELAKSEQCKSFTDPIFQGGEEQLAKFLQKNIRYPERALDAGIGGRCYLKFYIDSKGRISNISVMRGIQDCPECDYESVLVITKMPNWIPAECNGEKIGMYYHLPIKFTPG